MNHNPPEPEYFDSVGEECPYGECDGSGRIEIIGDSDHFECDVIGYKPCACRMDE